MESALATKKVISEYKGVCCLEIAQTFWFCSDGSHFERSGTQFQHTLQANVPAYAYVWTSQTL